MPEQVLGIHGLPEIPWDFAAIPTKIWTLTVKMPNGCWHTNEKHAPHFREVMVERLHNVNPRELFALTPTCGSRLCVNPAHLCVTVATPLSWKEK